MCRHALTQPILSLIGVGWILIALPTLAAGNDSDGDGHIDLLDNCSGVANPRQLDGDLDGIGNACDADINNDCIVNSVDLGLFRQRFFSDDSVADLSGDGVVNAVDLGLMRELFFDPPGPSGRPNRCTRPATGLVYAGTHADFPGATDTEEHLLFVDLALGKAVERLTPVLPQQSRELKTLENSIEYSKFLVLPDSSAVLYYRVLDPTSTCSSPYLKTTLAEPGIATPLWTDPELCINGRVLKLTDAGDIAYFLGSETGIGRQRIVGITTDGSATLTFSSATEDLHTSFIKTSRDERWLHFARYDAGRYHAWAASVADPASEARLFGGAGTGSQSSVRPGVARLPDSSGAVLGVEDSATDNYHAQLFNYANLSAPIQLNPNLQFSEKAVGARLSPDGKTVYYRRSYRDGNDITWKLVAVDLDTPGAEIELADIEYGAGPFRISPDGNTIALCDSGSPSLDFRLRLISTQPGEPAVTVDRRIRNYDRVSNRKVAINNVMQFDPSGRFLYFTTSRPAGDPGRVFRVATDGDGDSEQIGLDHDSEYPPEEMLVSEDGQYVAYTIPVTASAMRELFVVHTDRPGVAIKLNGKPDALTLVDDFEFIYGPAP